MFIISTYIISTADSVKLYFISQLIRAPIVSHNYKAYRPDYNVHSKRNRT